MKGVAAEALMEMRAEVETEEGREGELPPLLGEWVLETWVTQSLWVARYTVEEGKTLVIVDD